MFPGGLSEYEDRLAALGTPVRLVFFPKRLAAIRVWRPDKSSIRLRACPTIFRSRNTISSWTKKRRRPTVSTARRRLRWSEGPTSEFDTTASRRATSWPRW